MNIFRFRPIICLRKNKLTSFKNTYYSRRILYEFGEKSDKYSEKLQSELELEQYQGQENESTVNQLKHIFNLIDNKKYNSLAIQDLTKELETKVEFNNYEDKEFYKLLEQEKLELEQKSIDCVHQLLDEIYKYEQNKDTELIGSGKINVLFEITAGVGGKEAMLFANELFEMYYHYFAYKRWTISDLETDEQNGMMRHVRGKVEGLDVWNHLRFEAGVHRVQRVPETESKGRIHTSTATVACIPLSSDIDIDLNGNKQLFFDNT